MNNRKENFTSYHESNNNNIENDDSMSRYTYVNYVVKPLINLDRLVIIGKCQTSVFYVRTSSPYPMGSFRILLKPRFDISS